MSLTNLALTAVFGPSRRQGCTPCYISVHSSHMKLVMFASHQNSRHVGDVFVMFSSRKHLNASPTCGLAQNPRIHDNHLLKQQSSLSDPDEAGHCAVSIERPASDRTTGSIVGRDRRDSWGTSQARSTWNALCGKTTVDSGADHR